MLRGCFVKTLVQMSLQKIYIYIIFPCYIQKQVGVTTNILLSFQLTSRSFTTRPFALFVCFHQLSREPPSWFCPRSLLSLDIIFRAVSLFLLRGIRPGLTKSFVQRQSTTVTAESPGSIDRFEVCERPRH